MAVTPRLNTATPAFSFTSYITAAEYKQNPTGVDVSNLVPGNPGATDAELANRVRAASGWADSICGQSLLATNDTVTDRARVNRDGVLKVILKKFPIQVLSSFSYGTSVTNQVALSDLSNINFDRQSMDVPIAEGLWSSQGPLQLNTGWRPGAELFISYQAVSGFPVTSLAAQASAGATSVSVADGTGFVPGVTQFILQDGAQTEVLTASGTNSYVSGPTSIATTAAVQFTHASVGTRITGVPEDVRQAVVLLTSTLIQTRGAVAIIAPAVGGLGARYSQSGSNRSRGQKTPVDDNVDLACGLLARYTRLR